MISSKSKTAPGRLFVDKVDVLEEIIADSQSLTSRRMRPETIKTAKSSLTSIETRDSPDRRMREKMHREQLAIKMQQDDALVARKLKKSMQRQEELRDENFAKLLADIELSNETCKAIDKNLSLHFENQQNKVRRQFEDWNTNVHGKIQMDIARQLNEIDSKTLNKIKNDDYSKFLDVSNRKACIFRDIIIESEYDPLEPNRRALKARTMKLKDPTLIDQQKAEMEASMLPKSEHDCGKRRLCKETLNVELWNETKIKGTPYGAFAKLMSDDPNKPAKINATIRSNVTFDHFSFPTGKSAIDAEMPRGKRTQPMKMFSNPLKMYDDVANAELKTLFS